MDHPLKEDQTAITALEQPINPMSTDVNANEPNSNGTDIDDYSTAIDAPAPASDQRMPPLAVIPLTDQRQEFLDQFAHSRSSFSSRAHHRSIDDRGLKGTTLRSIYWKLFLGELDRTDMGVWKADLTRRRAEYEALCTKYRVKLATLRGTVTPNEPGERSRSSSNAPPPKSGDEEVDLKLNNPLSQSKDSPWTQYFQDNELSETIRHDLHRTHAEQEFFVATAVQDIMFNVLFLWSKEIGTDKDGRYRQGMNEILSPIILVCMRESQWKESWPTVGADGSSDADKQQDELLSQVLDRTYVEHDVYHLFCRIMEQIGQYFIKQDVNPKARAEALALKKKQAIMAGDAALTEPPPNPIDQTPIVRKCHYIHHILLSTLDPQLYAHLIAMDVSPNLYILRWYRLMLCREFHLEDTLLVWDVIFATMEQPPLVGTSKNEDGTPLHSNAFVLTEYVCIAMLLYVRQALLHGDNTFCLKRLLRYPPVEDIRVLLSRALHFLNSWKMITTDPTLTREVFDPAELERGTTRENGPFDGPWHTLTAGMDADAPLEDPLVAQHKKRVNSQTMRPSSTSKSASPPIDHHHQQQHQHHHPSPSPSSTSSAQQTARALFQDSFSSLKSFVKGAVAKAGELPQSSNAAKATSTSSTSSSTASVIAAKKQQNATLPANRGKLPQATGVSHFLSPAGYASSSPQTQQSSPSPVPSLSPPSAAEHDELVLLRKSLRAMEKERDQAHEIIRNYKSQLEDVKLVQKQMGALMETIVHGLEAEWEATSGNATTETKDSKQATEQSTPSDVASDAAVEPTTPSATAAATSTNRPFSEDVLLQGLAELKHVKDVLIGRLTLSDVIDYFQSVPVPTTPTIESDSTSIAPAAVSTSATPSRTQLLQDMAAIHARQTATAAVVASTATSTAGASFPYNLPPPSSQPKKFTPLFEPEAKPRDKVSELFELDEADALPGLYPSIHKVTVTEKEKDTKEANSATTSTPSTLTTVTSNAPVVLDPLLSPTPAVLSSQPASSPSRPPTNTTTAASRPPIPVAQPIVSAVSKELLSDLLSSPSSSKSASRSLFDSSPPSSPFGPTGAGSKLKSGGVFGLEDDDNSILLPSAKQFKPAPQVFPTAKSTNVSSAASSTSAATPSSSSTSKPVASSVLASLTATPPSTTAATSTRLFNDPLFADTPPTKSKIDDFDWLSK